MKTPLELAKEALDAALAQKKLSQDYVNGLGPAVVETLRPILDEIALNTKISKEDLLTAIANIKINVPKADVPQAQVDVKIPEIKVPEPKITVNIPKIDTPIIPPIKIPAIKVPKPEVTINPRFTIPEIKMPAEMDIKGWINIMGYDKGLLNNPLPVQLRDASGKPISLGGITQILGGGGGGKADYFTIKGYGQSAFAELLNPDGRVKVEMPAGAAGLTDIELRAAHLDVQQLSGSVDSVYVTGASGSLAAAIIDSGGIQYSGSNPLPVTITSGGTATSAVNIVDSSGIAYSGSNPVPVVFGAAATQGVMWVDSTGIAYEGANPAPITGTVGVSGITASVAASLIDSTGWAYEGANPFPVYIATGSNNSVAATILNGEGLARDSWLVSDVTNSVKTALIDSTGIQYSGSNPVPIGDAGGALTVDGTVAVSGITASVAASIIDSTGIGYSGSNPMPISGNVNVNGALNSVIATGVTLHHTADDGDAPLKIGGVAIQANPAAVDAGDRVKFVADDLGRQLNRPIQVRDSLATAYVALTNGTETTLLSAVVGSYFDLIYVMGANTSDVAAVVDIRPVTGGNITHTFVFPTGTQGFVLPVPYPQTGSDGTGNNWTVDMGDITGTTIYLSALFSKEI